MDITIKIDNQHIRHLIQSAGVRGWAHGLKIMAPRSIPDALAFSIVECPDDERVRHVVTEAMIAEGLAKMAASPWNEGGHHFKGVLNPFDSDMYTGDALIQFAIFGKLKYV